MFVLEANCNGLRRRAMPEAEPKAQPAQTLTRNTRLALRLDTEGWSYAFEERAGWGGQQESCFRICTERGDNRRLRNRHCIKIDAPTSFNSRRELHVSNTRAVQQPCASWATCRVHRGAMVVMRMLHCCRHLIAVRGMFHQGRIIAADCADKTANACWRQSQRKDQSDCPVNQHKKILSSFRNRFKPRVSILSRWSCSPLYNPVIAGLLWTT